jgi:signal transduction histidine kinase
MKHSNAIGPPVSTPVDFRLLVQSGPGLLLILTPEYKIVAVSDAYLRATMTERADILGRDVFDVFPDNPNEAGATGVSNLRTSLEKVVRTKEPDVMPVQKYDIRRPQGQFEERYWSPVNSPAIGEDGELHYLIHRVEDVTEFVRLKQIGDEQMAAEIFLRTQEVAEANRQLKLANQQLAAVFEGVARLMAQMDSELQPKEPNAAADSIEEPNTPAGMLARVERLLAGHKRLEEELRQAQKMEAIGRLAGGIAHDFNNELTVILGCSELIVSKLRPQDRPRSHAQEIVSAAERAGALTRQLLAFSRKQVLQPQLVSLAATLKDMDSMLRRVLREDGFSICGGTASKLINRPLVSSESESMPEMLGMGSSICTLPRFLYPFETSGNGLCR